MKSKSKEETKQDSFDNILNKVRKPLDFLNFISWNKTFFNKNIDIINIYILNHKTKNFKFNLIKY